MMSQKDISKKKTDRETLIAKRARQARAWMIKMERLGIKIGFDCLW